MGDAINPDYYKAGWSNGVELIDITENLTGNGAQAVQYVARSTRLDGVLKGDPVEDLTKAVWFIQREIQRLGGSTNADPSTEAYEKFYDLLLSDQVNPDPEPTVYHSIRDVPEGIRVFDNEGDHWKCEDGDWYFDREGNGEWASYGEIYDADMYAPFTEVKESF
jgi:hypothetical protein